jgi:hypothetical protein
MWSSGHQDCLQNWIMTFYVQVRNIFQEQLEIETDKLVAVASLKCLWFKTSPSQTAKIREVLKAVAELLFLGFLQKYFSTKLGFILDSQCVCHFSKK